MPFFPVIAAGDIGNADLLQKFATLAAVKSADETITSNATNQDDDHLSLSVATNATYLMDLYWVYNSNTTAGFRWNLTFPAGASFSSLSLLWNSGTLAWLSGLSSGTAGMAGNNSSDVPVIVKGALFVGATAGTLQFQWAQNTSNASNTTVRKGSHLNLIRVA